MKFKGTILMILIIIHALIAVGHCQKVKQFVAIHDVTAFNEHDGMTPGITMAYKKMKVHFGACACPKRYPFLTVFYWIEKNLTFICYDRGSLVEKYNRVDIYLPALADVNKFGNKKKQKFLVTIPERKKK